MRSLAVLGLALSSPAVLACKGPRSGELIAGAVENSLWAFTLEIPIFLFSLWLAARKDQWLWFVPQMMLLLSHPAWTVNANGGDCGITKQGLSWTFLLISSAFALRQSILARRTLGNAGGKS